MDEHGTLDLSHLLSEGMVAIILPEARYIIMLMPYGGFTTGIVAVFMINGAEGGSGDRAALCHFR